MSLEGIPSEGYANIGSIETPLMELPALISRTFHSLVSGATPKQSRKSMQRRPYSGNVIFGENHKFWRMEGEDALEKVEGKAATTTYETCRRKCSHQERLPLRPVPDSKKGGRALLTKQLLGIFIDSKSFQRHSQKSTQTDTFSELRYINREAPRKNQKSTEKYFSSFQSFASMMIFIESSTDTLCVMTKKNIVAEHSKEKNINILTSYFKAEWEGYKDGRPARVINN
ncbi:hypothetical protein G9A89_020570 [Geosiphon pyriformis]|nr:hypothetical protein G9A89_020570 [Geosiphon pyriformis]